MADLMARAMAQRAASIKAAIQHPYQNKRAFSMGRPGFFLPEPIIHGPLLGNGPGWPDGARYITILNAAAVLSSPIDCWYAYVSSHDGTTIWLATAPQLLGPWTWRQQVLSLTQMTILTNHLASPSAIFSDGQINLYCHGVVEDGSYWTQPTALARSTDGLTFTQYGSAPVIAVHANHAGKFYGLSTSYARIIKDGDLWLAFFQANWTSYTSVGIALSEDGLNWRVRRRPLFANVPNELGPFAPIPVKLWDRWLILCERVVSSPPTQIEGHVSVTNDILGDYMPIGPVISNGGRFNEMEWPFPVIDDDRLYLFFGASPPGGGQFAIYAAEFRVGGI